ncbi:hypothetical protein TrST_g5767 [Triparma strigata]|uniref:Cyclic nucleotide-binding domain-containing protein n=1 Tax=Triparma strigata TaxID=1606541 RepID=A0A9W7DXC9_9STRA|nr:hypothetical protein TrST_g5767 [Triparma strigata]
MGHGASLPHMQSDKMNWLSNLPAFRDLDESKMNVVASKAKILQYKKDDVVIQEGTVGSLFGILVSGCLQISATGPNQKEVIICKQSPGYFFGETAILGNTTTTATLKALEPSAILCLTSKELQELTVENNEVRSSLLRVVSLRMKQNLMKIPIFAQMEMVLESKKYFKVLGAFDLLSTLFEVETFAAKETLFTAGEPGEKFYVVCEGCIRISSKDVKEGKDVTLSMCTKDNVFGEIALLEETTRTATAISFEPTITLSITREKFASLLEVFPEFSEVITPLLKQRTSNTLRHVPFFSSLGIEKVSLIGQMVQFTSYLRGMKIVKEGDRDDGIYILIEGSIRVLSGGKQVGVMNKGDIMGEVSLLGNCRRTSDLITEEHCRMLHMNPDNCRRLMGVVPEVMEELIKLAQGRRRVTVEVLGEEKVSEFFPVIDESKDNKLHLYGLLRNGQDVHHEDHQYLNKKVDRRTDEEIARDLKILHNSSQLEGQFLDVQIFDLLTCIKLLEHQVQMQKDGHTDDEVVETDGEKDERRRHRNSWPRGKYEMSRQVTGYDYYNYPPAQLTPQLIARKLGSMQSRTSGQVLTNSKGGTLSRGKSSEDEEKGRGASSPRAVENKEDDEAVDTSSIAYRRASARRESEVLQNFDKFSAAAMAAATTNAIGLDAPNELDDVSSSSAADSSHKKRRASAPDSHSSGGKRKSFGEIKSVTASLPENTHRAGVTPAPVRGKKFFADDDEDDGDDKGPKKSRFPKPVVGDAPDEVLPENIDRAGMTPAPVRRKKFNFDDEEVKGAV